MEDKVDSGAPGTCGTDSADCCSPATSGSGRCILKTAVFAAVLLAAAGVATHGLLTGPLEGTSAAAAGASDGGQARMPFPSCCPSAAGSAPKACGARLPTEMTKGRPGASVDSAGL